MFVLVHESVLTIGRGRTLLHFKQKMLTTGIVLFQDARLDQTCAWHER